jgi:CubicO group peptidase (beta-lactamase class C family)
MIRPSALAALASFILVSPVRAQDRTAAIDSIFAFATPSTPGCAVGVSLRGTLVVNRAYGLANVERAVPLSQSSLFDIGSTQKQFTAAAVLLLVEDGRLSLSDDIRKHLPDLPDYGHTVTVDHLLTHTGGIRDWTGMLPMAPEGTDVLSLIHRQRGLDFVPGTEWSYSSSGFELAKEIVARVSGMSFAEFTRRRLFEPLGMKSSAYVPDILRAGPNAALGYQKEGTGWKPFMRLGNNRGGGAIVSTVSDLVVWTDALAGGKLGKYVTARIQEPARLSNGRTLGYARGLRLESTPRGRVVSHSGGAAGFSTWMGHLPEHGVSVAVACNFDPVSATALASRVGDVFLPARPAPSREEVAAVTDAPGVDVSGRAGLYLDERTGEPMRLVVSDGRLRIANGPPLVALAQDRFRSPRPDLFFRSQDAFEMTFPSNDRLEIRSMEGQTTRFRRAQSWTPTAADLQAVDGRYRSEELGSVLEILPGGNGLVMRFESAHEKSLELSPVERNMTSTKA